MKRIIGRAFYTLEEYITAKGADAFPAVMAEIAMTVPGSDPPVVYSSVDAVKNRYAGRLLFASGTDWNFFYGHLADIANNAASEFTSKKAAIDTLNTSLLANERKSTVEAKRADLGAVNFSSAYSDGGTITKSDAGNANIETIVRYQRDVQNLFDAAVDAFEPFFLAVNTSSFDDDVPQEEFAGDFDQLDNRPRYNSQLMDHTTNIPLVVPQQQADFSETNTQSPAYIKNKPEIPDIPENLVTSVNGESGDVTLTASDIPVTNSQSVQANLERIDENADALGARTDALEDSVSAIEGDLFDLDEAITALDNRLDSVETDLSTKSTVSGTSSSGAWRTLTIDGTTNSIPQGGGGGTTLYYHDLDVTWHHNSASFKLVSAEPNNVNTLSGLRTLWVDGAFQKGLLGAWLEDEDYGIDGGLIDGITMESGNMWISGYDVASNGATIAIEVPSTASVYDFVKELGE